MRKYNLYRNIFYYYRGPSYGQKKQADKQIEDNTTKALLNTLEYSNRDLLLHFFQHLKIKVNSSDKILFDLQVEKESSRPDGLIRIDTRDCFIESKIDAPLDNNQIERHIESNNKDYLICITPREKDSEIIKKSGRLNVIFISWSGVYSFFKGQLNRQRDDQTKFLISQFLDYLESINMAPFNGWNKKDFEAFLNIEDDPKRELRIRVKQKLSQYLKELENIVKKGKFYRDLVSDVQNIKVTSVATAGVLCKSPVSKKVHQSHFNFVLSSDEFFIGVQIEGKTPANRMLNNITHNKTKFLGILKDLENFHLIIRRRVNESGRPRGYVGIDLINMRIQKDISLFDVEYIIQKMNQLKLFEIHCAKFFKRDDLILNKQSFLNEGFEIMKQLERYFIFSDDNKT